MLPTVHYNMGGIPTNLRGQVAFPLCSACVAAWMLLVPIPFLPCRCHGNGHKIADSPSHAGVLHASRPLTNSCGQWRDPVFTLH